MKDDCCIYNEGIVCYTRKEARCRKCGWNPSVLQDRIKADAEIKKCHHVFVVTGYKNKDGKLCAKIMCEKCGYRTLAEIKT